MKPLPTQEYLKECFDYDPETGILYWKERPINHFKNIRAQRSTNTRFAGKKALNAPDSCGYLRGILDGKQIRAHRVIWKLWYGTEPNFICHEKGNITDNRIDKLSSDTHAKNMLDKKLQTNNTSGVNGVDWHSKSEKWRVRIGLGRGINKHLGYFKNLQHAIDTRKQAEVEYGYHPDHGNR